MKSTRQQMSRRQTVSVEPCTECAVLCSRALGRPLLSGRGRGGERTKTRTCVPTTTRHRGPPRSGGSKVTAREVRPGCSSRGARPVPLRTPPGGGGDRPRLPHRLVGVGGGEGESVGWGECISLCVGKRFSMCVLCSLLPGTLSTLTLPRSLQPHWLVRQVAGVRVCV